MSEFHELNPQNQKTMGTQREIPLPMDLFLYLTERTIRHVTICYGFISFFMVGSVEAADLLEPIIDFTLLWVKRCLSSSHQIYDVEPIQSIRIR